MAEALVNHHLGQYLRAISAGTHPAARVAEGAIEALKMAGISADGLHPKDIGSVLASMPASPTPTLPRREREQTNRYASAMLTEPIDLIVTVCDNAKESCPVFPHAIPSIHMPFHDPHGESLASFVRVRDDIMSRLLPALRTHFGLPQSQPSRAQLVLVVAMAKNRTIGINNTLPWRIPEDLKHFKKLTMGHHMIMGRKTFESIGKPLPGRITVVVSRDRNLKIDGCIVAHSLQDAVANCASDTQIFVVGGADIYVQALELADTLYITEIQQDVIGDAWFSEFDRSEWLEVSREKHRQETPEPLEYHFVEYRRKS